MDVNTADAVLGYKFETDPKKSIIQLPSNDPVAFDTMLEKAKSRIARARTCAVVLEIHNLVEFTALLLHKLSFSDVFTGSQTTIHDSAETACCSSQVILDC